MLKHNKSARRRYVREESRRYLVVTDGRVTETSYFERLNQLSRDVIIIERVKHPKDLVSMAVGMMNNGNYDGVFIICDIDEHCKNSKNRTAFERMLDDANNNNITTLCSHESFEVWLLCHKVKVSAGAKDRKVAQKMAVDLGLLKGNNAKLVIDKEITAEAVNAASREAKRLRQVYGDNILDDGPTTDVDYFIDLLRF